MNSKEKKAAYAKKWKSENKDHWNAYIRNYNKKRNEKNTDKWKKLQNEYGKRKYLKKRQEYFTVYYLPEEHYVGMTNCLKKRLYTHNRDGKIINNWEIIANFKRAVDAHLYETKLHSMGYEGFFVGNFKIKEYE